MQTLTVLNVEVISEQEACAVTVHPEKGPLILYSDDRGDNWREIPAKGNNAAVAISGDRKTLCITGTKSYCARIDQFSEEWPLNEVRFKAISRDVAPISDSGFAMIGLFYPSSNDRDLVNGIAYCPNINNADWTLIDIGLNAKDGYYALHGAFPSQQTWYVTSGSWPVITDHVANSLSGRLYLVPRIFPDYKYEFHSLRDIATARYYGAISKTTNGGKTWRKVFDSNHSFYLNQISCIHDLSCFTVGEGTNKTVVLQTKDGGDHWTEALTLVPDFSLYTVSMLSENIIWVVGDTKVKRNLRNTPPSFIGIYYFSVDGGFSWEMKTGEGYAYDLAFYDMQLGYAATIFDSYGGVARYSKE